MGRSRYSTVARDFFCLGLFHDRLYVGPRFEAKIISNLAKLLVFFYESSLWATAGIEKMGLR
jgi:hypothetical protein